MYEVKKLLSHSAEILLVECLYSNRTPNKFFTFELLLSIIWNLLLYCLGPVKNLDINPKLLCMKTLLKNQFLSKVFRSIFDLAFKLHSSWEVLAGKISIRQ